jgi:hypothetical protein
MVNLHRLTMGLLTLMPVLSTLSRPASVSLALMQGRKLKLKAIHEGSCLAIQFQAL